MDAQKSNDDGFSITSQKFHSADLDIDSSKAALESNNISGSEIKSPFEHERDILVSQITESMNNVLNNLNALNRALEGVVEVGKEFESISTLWNNYYDGMARVQIQQQQQQQQAQEEQDNAIIENNNEQQPEMPDILDPYSIADLPRTSEKLASTLTVSFGDSAASSKAYFGVSQSALSSYSLKTTARQLWTHPVSPLTQISAVCAATKKDATLFYGVINSKGKASLHQVTTKKQQLPSTSNTQPNSVEPTLQQQQEEEEDITLLEKCDYISAIHKSKSSSSSPIIYLAFNTGEIAAFKIQNNQTSKIWDLPPSDKNKSAIFTRFIKPPSKDLPEDGLVVTFSAEKSNDPTSFEIKVVSLDPTEGRLLSSKSVSISSEEIGIFDLSDHDLYRYVASKSTLHKYSILDPTKTSAMKIPSKKDTPASPATASIISLGNDQVLLSTGAGDALKLVDLQYQVLLSERSLEKPIHLVAYSKKLAIVIGYTSNSSKPSSSSQSAATSSLGPNKIVAVPLDIGRGSLFESIGKGITKGDNTWRNTFSQIPITFGDSASSDQVIKEETSLLNNAKNSASHVLKILQHFKDAGDVASFEKWALAYLKFPNKWIKASKSWTIEETIKATTVPEVEYKRPHYKSKTDRQVDFTFIYDLCTIIFRHVGKASSAPLSLLNPAVASTAPSSSSSASTISAPTSSSSSSPKQVKLVKLHKGFVPDRLLSYLLSHPLLPSQQLPGLLLTLNRFPDLVRSAIKRAPSLRCDTVVSALRASDRETFVSAVIRLEHAFDTRQITASLKRVYLLAKPSSSSSIQTKKNTEKSSQNDALIDLAYSDNGVTLEAIVRRMVELDVGWDLMPQFIDAGGLFGWEEAFLDDLDACISKRVGTYKAGYEVIAMLEETLRETTISSGKRTKDDAAKENVESSVTTEPSASPVLLSAKEQKQQRMKSVLHIGFADKYVYNKKESNSAIAPYTVERLLL